MNNVVVGKVISIEGRQIKVLMNTKSNSLTYFYDGQNYNGASIGEYLGIIRGPYKIVAQVINEFLDDKFKDFMNETFSKDRILRLIDLSVVGYFKKDKFIFGSKYFPMIFNEVVLLNDKERERIINQSLNTNKDNSLKILLGKSYNGNVNVELPVNGLFNSHIGIFGNTGSGKSNTLAKIYYEVLNNEKIHSLKHSKFIFFDFNGEYVEENSICNRKKIVNLSTRKVSFNKIKISKDSFWNEETLSILFSATDKTQKPFIKSVIKNLKKYGFDDINVYLGKEILECFELIFNTNESKESLDELKRIYKMLGIDDSDYYETTFANALWHSKVNSFYIGKRYFNSEKLTENEISNFLNLICIKILLITSDIEKLIILCDCHFIKKLCYKEVNYDFIKPLFNRMEADKVNLENTIIITDEEYEDNVIVYSFKDCNIDMKKKLPLLISKDLYEKQIDSFDQKDDAEFKTCHLIIDEAHNILSEESIREAESFKDYRLEVFEQIIKEGRKFGFYLTIASQRPHDISPTLTSQINNYFIHRLVNDLDLRMLSNSISFLDNISKELIPTLNPGECILTGQLVKLPIIVCVDKLKDKNSPKSENVDLDELWRN